MPLTKVQFKPGVNRESTSFADSQGWFDSNLIRFRKGRPEKIGGWERVSGSSVEGTVRSLKCWVTLGALKLMGAGTTSKFYIENGNSFYDITPVRSTATLGRKCRFRNYNSNGGRTWCGGRRFCDIQRSYSYGRSYDCRFEQRANYLLYHFCK